MILHAIELTSVGPFRTTMKLGPFSPGLNLVCAPNESGKSTALRAAARHREVPDASTLGGVAAPSNSTEGGLEISASLATLKFAFSL